MKILLYTSHPAQFLFFRESIKNLSKKGHQIKLLIKSKDVLEDLVKHSGFEYINILKEGRQNSLRSILFALIKRNIRLNKICRNFKPHLMIGTDPSLAQIGFFRKIPVITSLEDDINVIPRLALMTYPFTNYIFAPEICSVGKYSKKKLSYNGLMKLAYLHPKYFEPDINVKNKIIDRARYSLIRLSALEAHHDINESGISEEFLHTLIARLQKSGEVFISSEKQLPKAFENYRLAIDPTNIHHVLSYSQILISDSQSMSIEAAILGTPSIRISSFSNRISVLEELEHKYQLTFGFKPENKSGILKKMNEILINHATKEFEKKSTELITDKIDVSSFLTWMIDGFPSTIKQIQNDPKIQYQFK